ncbi:hypothetical protein ACP4OV_029107 [Aristida adscensionis]
MCRPGARAAVPLDLHGGGDDNNDAGPVRRSGGGVALPHDGVVQRQEDVPHYCADALVMPRGGGLADVLGALLSAAAEHIARPCACEFRRAIAQELAQRGADVDLDAEMPCAAVRGYDDCPAEKPPATTQAGCSVADGGPRRPPRRGAEALGPG